MLSAAQRQALAAWGRTRQRHFAVNNFKPRKTLENAARTHRQLHVEACRNGDAQGGAVLGGLFV